MKQIQSARFWIGKKTLVKDMTVYSLAGKYIEKAKNNLITMQILSDIQSNKEARKLLSIPENYSSDEWVTVSSYYAMYAAALALLAKIGYKSSAHAATISALNDFFVKKKVLDKEYLALLESAQLTKEEVNELANARENRETAQYEVTKTITHNLAETGIKNAYKFVERVRVIINKM
ncbi:MAG: HEPN domain-containing protein [Candidatus Pacearchaeota archaeon]|nr:HEPN domain-containing protein [Candidatus Pacearchaeota archaeon]